MNHQQTLVNQLGPIVEPVSDEANFGYRRGRSTKDTLREIWKEIETGNEWIADADLRDFFWSAEHETIVTLVATGVGRTSATSH